MGILKLIIELALLALLILALLHFYPAQTMDILNEAGKLAIMVGKLTYQIIRDGLAKLLSLVESMRR